MIVRDVTRVDVGLRKRAVDVQCCSAQPQRAIGSRAVDGVDQLSIRVVHVRRMQHRCGDGRRRGTFGDRRSRIGREHFFIVDRCDVDVDRAKILIGSAAGAGVAKIIDDHVDRIGIIAVQIGRRMKVLNAGRIIKVLIQISDRAGDGACRRCSTKSQASVGRQSQFAAGGCGQGDCQVRSVGIDVVEGDCRQIDV